VLLHNEGWPIAKIAQALRKIEASITRHTGDFAKRLKLKPRGGGSASHLNTEQTQQWLHICQMSLIPLRIKKWPFSEILKGLNARRPIKALE
jgi:hypothetical protein